MIANYTEHAANERTFLAWVRTAIAVVGFGLAAARLSSQTPSLWSEVAMLLAGAVVILLAFVRMRHIRTRLNAAEAIDDETIPSDALLLIVVAAFIALLASFVVHTV